jgi:hypothetical protein
VVVVLLVPLVELVPVVLVVLIVLLVPLVPIVLLVPEVSVDMAPVLMVSVDIEPPVLMVSVVAMPVSVVELVADVSLVDDVVSVLVQATASNPVTRTSIAAKIRYRFVFMHFSFFPGRAVSPTEKQKSRQSRSEQ